MANTLKFGNGQWATGNGTALAYNDENSNFKPLPFDFTRASSGTVVNQSGLIETVGSGIPRIDFQGNTKGALLLEPSRTNKLSTSNDFNGSGWLISDIAATANQVVSPDGTLNASKLEMTGIGSLRNQLEASFNDGYAYSIFIKKGNSSYVTIRSAFFTQSIVVGFDLDTLTAQTNGKIEDYGNDWYRLSITKDISGDVDRSGFFYLYLPNSLGSQTSVSGNYIYAYGAQIEEGSYATSYIPTSGSAVTRVADFCTNGGNDQVINSTEGVLYYEGSSLVEEVVDKRIFLSNGTMNNYVAIGYSRFAGNIIAEMVSGGVVQTVNWGATGINKTNNNKFALSWGSGTMKFYVNGTQTNTESVTSPTGLNVLEFNTAVDTLVMYSNTRDLRVYNTALTDSELQALTTI